LASENGDAPYTLDADAGRRLRDYAFPGNVRELENILERAVALCDGGVIADGDLYLPQSSPLAPVSVAVPAQAAAIPVPPTTEPGARAPSEPLTDFIEQVERDAIVKALEECRYNKTRAAAKLGITFRALRRHHFSCVALQVEEARH